MAGMATIGMVISAVSTGVQMLGKVQEGKAAKQAANYQAKQLEVNAGQARASSQRQAIERKRQSTLLASRAQAISAAGGSALDPSTADIISDIDAEGEYGALNALYQGEETARGNIAQANVTRYEGKQAQQQGYYGAAGSAGSYFMKYGSDIFGSTSPAPAAEQYGPYNLPWLN